MPQWKDTRRPGVVLLAVVLMGAAPPVPECAGPSMLLGPCPVIRWEAPTPRTEPQTMLSNHVFAVPTPPGRLLAGSDPDFLIYPPDCSPGSTHLGPVMAEPGLPVTHRAVEWPSVLSTHGEWGLVSLVCDGYSRLSPLMLGYRWDALCPGSAIGGLLGVPEGGSSVRFLFSGEVGPGRELAAAAVSLECPWAEHLRALQSFERDAADMSLIPFYQSVDDLNAEYGRRRLEWWGFEHPSTPPPYPCVPRHARPAPGPLESDLVSSVLFISFDDYAALLARREREMDEWNRLTMYGMRGSFR